MHVECLAVGPIYTNCYIVSSNENSREVIVIDPGEDGEKIKKKIGDREVKAVLLTHGHFDHTGALSSFNDKPIYICEKEKDFLTDSYLSGGDTYNDKRERPKASHFVKEGDILNIAGVELEVLETPGHTAGSVCYLHGTTIFTGDTAFRGGYGRTDFPTGDFSALRDSLRRLYSMKGYKILPGHGPAGEIV